MTSTVTVFVNSLVQHGLFGSTFGLNDQDPTFNDQVERMSRLFRRGES